MDTPLDPSPTAATRPQGEGVADIVAQERGRLLGFIRRRVPNLGDAEDILQDVFYEFVRACSLPEPIEQAGAWLVTVARNRIVDLFRKKREEPLADGPDDFDGDFDGYYLDQALPPNHSGPEAAYARATLLAAISAALHELPAHERDVFISHELEGQSFKALSAGTGVNVNTLLGWKRRAVLHLRARLQPLYDELL
jgi:RNA polymerase sigma factor (sigma-70 family)